MRCQRCYDNSVTYIGPSIEKMSTREQVDKI